MKTLRDETAKDILNYLYKNLHKEVISRIPSSDMRELAYVLSDYVAIQNFNSIFDHLEKFQTSLLTYEEPSESDFLAQLKNI